jgi:hypothetical protein
MELPAPVERSNWGFGVEQLCGKAEVIAYCEYFFLSASPEHIERFITGIRKNPRFNLSSFEEQCLSRAHVFKAICKGMARTHQPDALHLWTAEKTGMDVFLTHDKAFRNVVDRQQVTLHCRVMFPSELLAAISHSDQPASTQLGD